MYLPPLSRLLLASALFVLSWSTSVLAAATVSVIPSGNSSYTVQGTTMDGVAGIQLDIAYDAASLAAPTVTQGGLVAGAMLAANTTRPGLITIAIISTQPFSGSGPIANITFASKTGSGGIPSITSKILIDSKGSQIASSTINSSTEPAASGNITSPVVPFSQPSQPSQPSPTSPTIQSGQPVSTAPTYIGSVTLPAEQQQRADSQREPTPTAPVYTGEPEPARNAEPPQPSATPTVDSKPEETPQYVVYKGILDRFKQYNGSKQLSEMEALFDKKVAHTIHQEPEILLSDGQSKATLTVDIPARIKSSPNFAVNGGKLVSFRQDKKIIGRWIVEVLPVAASYKTSVTIIAGAEEFDFPLTVVPLVKMALALDERGWNRFLKEAGTGSAPLHDLNNDGVRDYIDEFIFVANRIARKTTQIKPAPPSTKSAR